MGLIGKLAGDGLDAGRRVLRRAIGKHKLPQRLLFPPQHRSVVLKRDGWDTQEIINHEKLELSRIWMFHPDRFLPL